MDWLIFGSLNLVVVTIMFLVLGRRLRRQYNAGQFLAQVQQEANAIITELNHTTERNIQLLEERLARVREATEELDRRIMLAEREDQKRRQNEITYQHVVGQRRAALRDLAADSGSAGTAPAPVAAPVATEDAVAPAVPVASEPVQPVPAAAPIASAAPASPGRTAAVRVQRAAGREALKAQVVDLHRAGMAPALIAQHCGITPGEAELIIALHGGEG